MEGEKRDEQKNKNIVFLYLTGFVISHSQIESQKEPYVRWGSRKDKLLEELHRVLKSDGVLFATAEHLDPNEFMNIFARGNLFTLIEQRGEVFRSKRD